MKPKFSSGDKVFAKVRGYPSWPARVEGLADETPNKMRYHVYFYGTGETAVVKAEDICSYVHNKAKLGKTKKTKNFLEAVVQIEGELSPEETQILEDLEKNPQSEGQEGNQNDEGGSSKRTSAGGKPKTPTSGGKPRAKDKKRKIDNDSGTDEPETRRGRTSSVTPDTEVNNSKTSPEAKKARPLTNLNADDDSKNPEVLSRSGRKIKPRRFADFEDEVEESGIPRASPAFVKVSQKKDKDWKTISDQENMIVYVNNEKVKIPLHLNRPNLDRKTDLINWTVKVRIYAGNLKEKLESGAINPSQVESIMDEWTRKQAQYGINFDLLKVESKLLELDLNLRTSLSIKSPDVAKSLDLLDELAHLKLTSLMLKKHPDIVLTIKKIRNYIGTVPRPRDPENEKEIREGATLVRQKAEHIYNKFQSLFFVPSNKNFWDVFCLQKERFECVTKNLTNEEFIALVEDPDEMIGQF